MQQDYNKLWRNANDSQTPDTQFYNFFEDSLNQFISTNSGNSQPNVSKTSEQSEITANDNEQHTPGTK